MQPKAEAAIAVWDEKNIEQDIQTAIKTAAILDVRDEAPAHPHHGAGQRENSA